MLSEFNFMLLKGFLYRESFIPILRRVYVVKVIAKLLKERPWNPIEYDDIYLIQNIYV